MYTRARRRFLIDKSLQLTVVWRALVYLSCCLSCVVFFTFLWMVIRHRPLGTLETLATMRQQFGPAILAVLFLIPIVVSDCIRLTHRVAGPLFRIRMAVKQLADGEPTDTIELRRGDFLNDIVDDLNRVIEQRQCAEDESSSPTA